MTVSSPSKSKTQEKIDALQLDLLESLQSTLDIQALCTLLLDTVDKHIRLSGLHYQQENLGINIYAGQQASHSCGYRLMTTEENLGELTFTRNQKFSGKELARIESMLTTILNPLRNALRFRAALDVSLKDPLTGAGKQDMLIEVLQRETELAKRHNYPLSILLLDVDDLKKINTTYGENDGDTVLKHLVRKVQMIFRDTDMIFRVSGEEFMVLMSHTNEQGALAIAERIRNAVDTLPCKIESREIAFSVSAAVATLSGTDTVTSLIDRAYRGLETANGG